MHLRKHKPKIGVVGSWVVKTVLVGGPPVSNLSKAKILWFIRLESLQNLILALCVYLRITNGKKDEKYLDGSFLRA